MSTVTVNNWSIATASDGTAITVGAASAATQLAAPGDTARIVAGDVMIDNPGPKDVFVRCGTAGVFATLNSMRVPAGSIQPFAKGQSTHIACICQSGTQPIVVHVGEGA